VSSVFLLLGPRCPPPPLAPDLTLWLTILFVLCPFRGIPSTAFFGFFFFHDDFFLPDGYVVRFPLTLVTRNFLRWTSPESYFRPFSCFHFSSFFVASCDIAPPRSSNPPLFMPKCYGCSARFVNSLLFFVLLSSHPLFPHGVSRCYFPFLSFISRSNEHRDDHLPFLIRWESTSAPLFWLSSPPLVFIVLINVSFFSSSSFPEILGHPFFFFLLCSFSIEVCFFLFATIFLPFFFFLFPTCLFVIPL